MLTRNTKTAFFLFLFLLQLICLFNLTSINDDTEPSNSIIDMLEADLSHIDDATESIAVTLDTDDQNKGEKLDDQTGNSVADQTTNHVGENEANASDTGDPDIGNKSDEHPQGPNKINGNKTNTKHIPNTKSEKKAMNVILLYPDDWRHDSLGSVKPHIRTPFLDQLGKWGIRFSHNCVTTSVCWMSRATLFTGQYTSEHKSYKLKCPQFTKPEAWNNSWPALLQRVGGYFVGHIGKWQYTNQYDVKSKKLFDWSRFNEGRFHFIGSTPASEVSQNHAIEFLRTRPKNKPFALTVAFYPPKPVGNSREPGMQFKPDNATKKLYENVTIADVPYNMSEAFHTLPQFLQDQKTFGYTRWSARYRTPEHYQESMRNYYALITQVDLACKNIVDELKDQKLENETMIIFTTDNGMHHGAHGLAGKWYPYQESIRVPLIVYDPRIPDEKRGTVDESFTLNIDLAETILGAAGIVPPSTMQGRDISDLYLIHEGGKKRALEKNPWREEFFYEFPSIEEERIPSSTALVRKEWKYINWPKQHDYDQIFHLKSDPLELNDMREDPDTKDVLNEMKQRHAELKNDIIKDEEIKCL